MSEERIQKIGIQRELDLRWMEFAQRLHTSGVSRRECRQQIYEYLDTAPGFDATPTQQTKIYVANLLVKTWLFPEPDVLALRDAAADLLEHSHSDSRVFHWALIGAAYPFWFAVARIVGRLLFLQESVTQPQIFSRLTEQYGDRQTVSRRARYVIRSFVRWGVLRDTDVPGSYSRGSVFRVEQPRIYGLLIEALLRSGQREKMEFGQLSSSPSLFPFSLQECSAEQVLAASERITADRYAFNDVLVSLK